MAVTTPIGHGPLDATVTWNRSPPMHHKTEQERDIEVSKASGQLSSLNIQGEQHQILPEQGGLHGIALRPRQEHYHNFLFPYGRGSAPVYDNWKIVKSVSDAGKNNLINFFGWSIIPGWYREMANDPSGTPMLITPVVNGVDDTESSSGSTTTISDYQERKLRGAKWGYRLTPVPINSFGMTGSGLQIDSDEKVSKLVPYQTQLQGSENGPTGIGVHWGLMRKVDIPFGLGFVLDFYINKDIDPLTNDRNIIDPGPPPKYKNVTMYRPTYRDALMRVTSNIYNSDVFTGSPAAYYNSAFYFLNKSYIVIQITGATTATSTGNCFFIVITSDAHAKLFQVHVTGLSGTGVMNKGNVRLLSEYNPSSGDAPALPSGMRLLRGDRSGHLSLSIRQVMNHILIENNIFATPWVIPLAVFKPHPSTGPGGSFQYNVPISTTGHPQLSKLGGTIKVFGGNLSTGITFSHLNYHDESEVEIDEMKVFGRGRRFYTRLSTYGTHGLDSRLRTSGEYFANGAQQITDSNGSGRRTTDLSGRIDQYFGGYGGSVTSKSELIVTDTKTNTGSHTALNTTVKLKAGTGAVSFSGGSFNLGKCTTPVFQYAKQRAPKETDTISTTTRDIADIIETIEITKEAEDYHAVSVTGSMTVNVWTPSYNQPARDAVVDSIGKARYLRIDLSHQGCAASNLQAYRSGTPPFGSVSSGSGGDRTLFTGIAFNPVLSEEAGKRMIKFELRDYWVIFESKLIINSPYFDGAIDTDVIEYLADHTGFTRSNQIIHGGSRDAFPISFDFKNPIARFKERQSVAEAIKQTAKKYSKYAFFDNKGRFCYQRVPTVLLSGSGGTYNIKYNFFSSHIGSNANVIPIGPGYGGSSPTTPGHNSQIAYQVKTTQWNNKDIFNKILLQTVDGRTRGYVVVSDANWNSLTDENSLGFLGYERAFLQDEAAIGDFDRARLILRYYTRMFKPTYTITWKCIGGNVGVDIFDVVTVDGRMVVIDKITHSIDAKNNSWETEYTGEWIYPPSTSGGTLKSY